MNHQNYHTLINFFPLKFSHHISQDALPTFDQRLHPGIFLNKRQAVVWCQEVPFVDSWLDIWQFDCQDPITWHQGILEIHSVFCLSSTQFLDIQDLISIKTLMFYQFFTQNPANFSNKTTEQNKNHHLNATLHQKTKEKRCWGGWGREEKKSSIQN